MNHRTPSLRLYASLITALGIGLVAARGSAQEGPTGKRLLDILKWQKGPGTADIGAIAEIKLPDQYLFLQSADAQTLLRAMGNPADDSVLGLLTPSTNLDWFVVFIYEETGHVKDDEKKDLNADKILAEIKKGEEESNAARRDAGYSGLTAVGWAIPPRYNDATHNLEWAIKIKSDEGRISINHRTKLLGRKGVMEAILVTGESELERVLPTFSACLGGYDYKSGQRYAEYRQGDKLAKYGLTALVVGGGAAVAAKMGFFGLLAAKLGKLLKPILIGLVAIGAFFGKFFKRLFGKKTDDQVR